MFHGALVALVTPMQADTSLAIDSLRELVEWHIESGTDGLVILGTTGEAPTINHQERATLIKHVVEQAKDRLPIIVGSGANSTSVAIELTHQAMELGADACLLVTPYYNKPTQEGLYLHYTAIAKAVPIPQILYNVPSRTACDLASETVIRLASISNIIGLKDATGDIDRVHEIRRGYKGDFDLFSGDDSSSFDFLVAGGKGVISVTGNIAPSAMHNMCKHALSGEIEEARAINEGLMPLHKNLFVESNPIPTKWALSEMGMIPEGIRLPLTVLSEGNRQVVSDALQKSGVEYNEQTQ